MALRSIISFVRGIGYYIDKIRLIKRGRAHGGRAPHKPILLLALIDLVADGTVNENLFPVSTALVEAFLKNWNLVRPEKPAIHLPLYHLQSDGFWHLVAFPDMAVMRFGSMSELKNNIAYGRLDDELFALLLKPENRAAIRESLINHHFPKESDLFKAAAADGAFSFRLEEILDRAAAETRLSKSPKRSPLFRSVILRLYDFTCAACRHRVITIEGVTAAEAAHIVPFSITGDNRAGNGISLCKLHHWAFDAGLVSIAEDHRLLVSDKFDETGGSLLFADLRDRPIILPSDPTYIPMEESLHWHRTNRFQV